MLEIERVTKGYGDRRALDDVDLAVVPGEVCGLLGPNGAGKTTLVSIVAGLRTADAGSVRVDGVDVAAGGASARAMVGLAAQDTAVYPTLTVRDNLDLSTRIAGFTGGDVARRLERVAEIVELTHLMGRPARHLSGGEKRRLHTAMALVHRPKVLLLDEPTTGVDIATRTRLLAAIRALVAEEGCAVVYSTHYLPEIEELGASVAILDHGRIIARGPLHDLVDRHGTGLLELTFRGPAPDPDQLPGLSDRHGVSVEGPVLRIVTERPGPDAAAILQKLGHHAERLESVDLARPSLETVFLAVTGRAYRADGPSEPDGGEGGPPGHPGATRPRPGEAS